jgi:CheY-like chemotaxis protein
VEARSAGHNRGSEFVVRLPTVRIERSPRAPGEGRDGGTSRALRILVADDNEDAAESLALMLRCLGHEVFTAHDGEAAVALAASVAPDVALLDVGMPRLSGHEAARRIRAALGGRSVMLVAVTGWGQAEDRKRSSAAGFDHHLVKPVDLAMLQQVIETAPPAQARPADAGPVVAK